MQEGKDVTDLLNREKEILSGLKDFQRATVERIFNLFTSGRSRVLVADEVGLGKTLIARGVIAKTAVYHKQTLNDELFKVVYVCSNQSIAAQNLSKLKINENDSVEGLSDTRLSMQHLKIFKDELENKKRQNYMQLIPLTPNTSFNMTSGGGSVQERALIYAVLHRYEQLTPYKEDLEKLLIGNATKSWQTWARDWYDKEVAAYDKASGGRYLQTVLKRLERFFSEHDGLLSEIINSCCSVRGHNQGGSYQIIHKLRRMMAEISVGLLDADLVIMDEFQRFPELIRTDADNETAMLARRFFNATKRDNERVKILLLSATPYKLYSTLEEINENQVDEHCREFIQVTEFLFESDPLKKVEFRKIWKDYSISLSEVGKTDLTVLTARKNKAEDALYQGICRTERLSVEGADKLIDIDTARSALDVSEADVLSYIRADELLQDIGLREHVPVDYIKSAPYILSFMEHYKLKEKVYSYFKKHPDKLKLARKRELWVDEKSIAQYKKLPTTNTRLNRIKEEALPRGAERLLWIPPSRSYYEPGGVFSGFNDFSKVLVFSAWEMVPRAVAVMLSYEAERLTVGELVKKSPNPGQENRGYFPNRKKVRFPAPRLKFNMREGAPASLSLMTLLYPCVTLAKLYNPLQALNQGLSRKQIESELRKKIKELLDTIVFTAKEKGGYDESWYYIAPLLFDKNVKLFDKNDDKNEKLISTWLNQRTFIWEFKNDETEANKEDDDRGVLEKHFDELRLILENADKLVLGRKPPDLVNVLTRMAMASPAVCALRLFGPGLPDSPALAVRLAKTLLDRFNLQEATAIVELSYGSHAPHWQNVLRYCVDGNLQAVLDEYAHVLIDDNGLVYVSQEKRAKTLCEKMCASCKTHTASYNVDTFRKFRDRIMKGEKLRTGSEKGELRFIRMRSGYAAGFYDTRGEGKSLQRKENLRLAFNSPFRPFVLATTSIGQEGLDFHYYCRKIAHWNLPSNPVALEQREGRINRYKCLAIRQNIAKKYGSRKFDKDIWREMFEFANKEEKRDMCPELVPFWCLPDHDKMIKIERIVPMYPLSKDQVKYERLIKILSLYRLTLGQARQEELLEYVLQSQLDEDQIKKLFINLSPYFKEQACLGRSKLVNHYLKEEY
jgi:hypothetical protein